MTPPPSKTKVLLAQFTMLLVIALIIGGALSDDFSAEVRQRIWQNVLDRPGGPMAFRFIIQPVMATIAAFRDGVRDGRTGRSPYLWTILTNRSDRRGRLGEGLISTAQIILVGLVMDTVYQVTVLKAFYPGEAAIVALSLAFLPYLLLRGPIARITRWWHSDVPRDEVR
jgi:hypothetical protein